MKKLLVALIAIVCLAIAALCYYMTNNEAVFGLFVGFDLALFVTTAILSKLTEAPESHKEANVYHSAHSL